MFGIGKATCRGGERNHPEPPVMSGKVPMAFDPLLPPDAKAGATASDALLSPVPTAATLAHRMASGNMPLQQFSLWQGVASSPSCSGLTEHLPPHKRLNSRARDGRVKPDHDDSLVRRPK